MVFGILVYIMIIPHYILFSNKMPNLSKPNGQWYLDEESNWKGCFLFLSTSSFDKQVPIDCFEGFGKWPSSVTVCGVIDMNIWLKQNVNRWCLFSSCCFKYTLGL